MRKLLIILLTLSCLQSVRAQNIDVKSLEELLVTAPSDSSELLSLESFVVFVLANHPVVKQAELLPEIARQELRLARGAFDPKLEASWDVKNFKGTEYYDIFNTSLKVPTWFPIDPKISVDRNKGVFLNPENTIPGSDDFRQVTAGLSLPIGRGLLIDQRRAAVKQAQIFSEINQAERIKLINKILLSAAKDYWNWYFAYYNFRLIDESMSISEEIYRRVRLDFDFGEVAAIDTVQAAITLQNRQVDRRAALIDFKRSGLVLSNYLWGENQEPLELKDELIPDLKLEDQALVPITTLDSLTELALLRHPDLVKTSGKLSQLTIDERLAKENLKPRVDLNYNLINSPIGAGGDFVDVQLRNNYKLGVVFEFPLFLRKERAKLKQTRVKIDQTSYEFNLRQREIVNDISAGYFALNNSKDMLELMQGAVDNYKRLLEAELFNLTNGESDLFKINFQQDKLLESQIKLMKLRAEFEKAKVGLFWSAGVAYLNFGSSYLD
ncbi:MAG: TolC family protein [Roseivirga sp.]|nr:TolC family protein [Roseivirga sp.]